MQRVYGQAGRLIAACAMMAAIVGIGAEPATAQGRANGSARATGSARTTLSGVYTAAQAMRGQDTFAGFCQGCHTPASHATPAFVNAWRNKPLLELYRYLSQAMPKSDPGTLSSEEYAQVLAYLLKLNGMPAGSKELPADTAVLQKIRFESKK